MTPMNLDEVDIDLAAFMGLKWRLLGSIESYLVHIDTGELYGDQPAYTEDLTSLIPVWEKLGFISISFHRFEDGKKSVDINNDGCNGTSSQNESSWTVAAAIETWKAVKEMISNGQ